MSARSGLHGRAAFGGVMLICALLGGAFAAIALGDDPPTSVGGVTYVHDVTSVSPPGRFTIDVACPAATRVSGGSSYSESGLQGQVQMSAPADGPDTNQLPDNLWRGRHSFSAGDAGQGLNAFVICLGGGVTYVVRSTVLHSGEQKSVPAFCDSAHHVAGGGAALSAAGSAAYVSSSNPLDSADAGTAPDDGWAARAFNGTGGDVTLRSVATCITARPAYRQAVQPVAAGSAGVAHADCPQTRHLVGAGGRVGGSSKDSVFAGAALEDGPDSDFAPDDTVNAAGRVFPSAGTGRTLTAYAVCR